jgi:heme A synthase
MSRLATSPDTTTASRVRSPLYSALIGLAALAILLQGLWAGLFAHEGKDYKQSWVDVHARGADIAILLAIAATVVAVLKLRNRRDLVFGTGALVVLLVVEAYIGGLIGDHSGLTAVHFPLAMALMGLAVWLPFRATRG